MFESLSKLQSCFGELTDKEKTRVNELSTRLNSLIDNGQYEESVNFAKISLYELKPYESEALKNQYKHEIVKQINTYIVYLFNHGKTAELKKLFNECEEYMENNILSYLITMTNYSCYLIKCNHARQSRSLIKRVHKIYLVNYLNNSSKETIEDIEKTYSNMSSINNNNKSYDDAIVNDMEALALSQFNFIMNGRKSEQLILSYYSLGSHQETLKRGNDAKSSFARAKHYLKRYSEGDESSDDKEKDKKRRSYPFIEQIKSNDDDLKIINFRDNLNHPDLTYLKCKKAELYSITSKTKLLRDNYAKSPYLCKFQAK